MVSYSINAVSGVFKSRSQLPVADGSITRRTAFQISACFFLKIGKRFSRISWLHRFPRDPGAAAASKTTASVNEPSVFISARCNRYLR
jgi:hypothetical protein